MQGSGGVGSFPNVAVYLDEQSAQMPGRNLDIYSADLQQVEVLEGPQGTLFGAGAQAGVVRYITNKPKLDVMEGATNASYGVTAGGDRSASADAMLNMPLIPDMLAARLVIYDDRRGGYINNIPGTFSRAATDIVSVNYFGGAVPPNSGPINNSAVAGNAFNPVTYQGARGELLFKLNEDWSALLTQSYQSMEADGVFWEEAYDGTGKTLPDLSVQLFNPTYDKDRFEDTQLTVNGRVDELKLVYAGGYLVRNIDQQMDYTNYSRGHYAGYYQCDYPGYPFKGGTPTAGSAGFCYSPRAYWHEQAKNTHQSHELRASTPDDWRLRAIGGIYWENYTIYDQSDWAYGTSPNFEPVAPPPGATSNDPSTRPPGVVYLQDITRGYTQKAAFASVDFDIIPKTLTVTAGTRYYDISDFEKGSNVGSFGCEIYGPYDGDVPPSPCTVPTSNGNNLNALNLNKTYVGFKSRGNITWHVTSDALVYYTWSQGFRPGGFNLRSGDYHVELTALWDLLPAAYLRAGHVDQQRDRLEERMARSSAAVQRGAVSGRLERRADHDLRPGRHRQQHLRSERPQLPGPRCRDLLRGACDLGPHGNGLRFVELERGREDSLSDQSQDRPADSHRKSLRRTRLAPGPIASLPGQHPGALRFADR